MSQSEYLIASNRLMLANGCSIIFEYPIADAKSTQSLIVVLLDVPLGTRDNRNVYAINDNAELLWRIERMSNLDLIGQCPYNGIMTVNEESVTLYNWCGFSVVVNIHTGTIISSLFTK